jgi:tetratricopeptide (TPR) repeat protein
MKRQIRVFVSSTFRDLQDERDVLVKTIFPQLRTLCESRGVTWGEVDLRWGVTDEAAADGRVLGICLDEIDRCRPYFIGLLGRRYGWVPESLSDVLVRRHPWLGSHRGRSVTELEMLHGVLLNPAMHAQAFFYFREEDQGSLAVEPHDEGERLDALKARIRIARDAGVCQLRDGYRNPTQLGQWVLEDFTRLVDQRFSEATPSDRLAREDAAHLAFAQSRSHLYLPRPADFAAVDTYVAGASTAPLVVHGLPGTGKSALLANWALRHTAAHPQDRVIMHFVAATPDGLSWTDVARRILAALKRDFTIDGDVPITPTGLASMLANWLRRVPLTTRAVLVIDALNQLRDNPEDPFLGWLPELPPNVRAIVSTVPGPTLEALRERRPTMLQVAPLSTDDRQHVIKAYLKDVAKDLDPHRIDSLASAPQTANARFLVTLLEELRVFGEHERLGDAIARYLDAPDVRALYARVLERYESDYSSRTDFVGEVLCAIWAARRGLSEVEVRDVVGAGDPIPAAEWSPFFLAASSCFISGAGLVNFSNDELRGAVEHRYLTDPENQKRAHLNLAAYFESREKGPRVFEELPWQLVQAGAWQTLADRLADWSFLRDASIWNNLEVQRYWVALEAHGVNMAETYRRAVDAPLDPEQRFAAAQRLSAAGYPREAAATYRDLAQLYGRRGDDVKRGYCLVNLSVIAASTGNIEEADHLLSEAKRIAIATGDDRLTRLTMHNEAKRLLGRGQIEKALSLFERVERLSTAMGDDQLAYRAIGDQALIHHARGNLDLALQLQQTVERYAREAGEVDTLVVSLGNQARILSAQGRTADALDLYHVIETHCRQYGLLDALQRTLHNEAVALIEIGQPDGARPLLEERAHLCQRLGYTERRSADELLAFLTAEVRKRARH